MFNMFEVLPRPNYSVYFKWFSITLLFVTLNQLIEVNFEVRPTEAYLRLLKNKTHQTCKEYVIEHKIPRARLETLKNDCGKKFRKT